MIVVNKNEIYNIGVLTVNRECMWRGLEMGEIRALASISIRFVPSHINSIFTVNTPILYLSCNKICKKKLFNLEIKKRQQKPHCYLNSSSGKGHGLIPLLR